MAPLVSFLSLLLLALSTVAVASPHIPRHLHSHGHRAPLPVAAEGPAVLPLRKRSLNKRCNPRPVNATSVAPSATAPINVAPVPSTPSSSPPPPSVPDTTLSSTSSYVPPATSSQAAATATSPPPLATSSLPPPPATSSSPPPAETSSSSNSGEPSFLYGIQNGQGTYYKVGLGACGIQNSDNQAIVAVSELLFDNYPGYNGVNPNTNPVCGKTLTITYEGVSVTATVTDRCTGCKVTDLDMSPALFGDLASLTVGRIDIDWEWS